MSDVQVRSDDAASTGPAAQGVVAKLEVVSHSGFGR